MKKAILLAICIPATALADVVRLEYMRIIGSSQNVGAFLLTDYVPKSNTVIRAKYASSSASARDNNQFLFCSRLTAGAAANILNFNFAPNVGGKFRFDYYATQAAASSSFEPNRPYELLVSGGKAYVTDTVTGAVTAEIGPGMQSFVPQYKMMLFKSYSYNNGEYNSRDNSFHGKFYYLKIYEIEDGEEVLKHDFVPCLEGGVVKLCDLADADKTRHALTLDSGASVLPPKEYTIEAPGGVGDVIALTNLLANMPTVSDNTYNDTRIWLEPGLYDLRGIHMTSTSHLSVKHSRGLMIAGLGDGPKDTILLGGGEAEGCRVLRLEGGGNYWWNTISNLTITGGYVSGSGGGGVYAGSVGTLYVDCVVSNNFAIGERWTSAGGCMNGCAVRCLFANNTGGYAGGGLECGNYKTAMSLQPYTVDCVFSNNVLAKTYNTSDGGGAVAGGVHTRGKFYFNRAPYGGAGGPSETSGRPAFVDCEFVGNSASTLGGALHNPAAVTNCMFVCNTNTTTSAGGGAIYASSMSEEGFSIVDCAFTNNVASGKHGGALCLPGGVTNCTFFGNIAGDSGGAIYATGGTGSKEIVGCSFVSNCAAQGSSKWGHGGAIRTADDMPNVQIRSCVFSGGNRASHGDAVYCGDLTDCVITNHNRSGAAYILYNCNLTRCLVANNSADQNATAVDYSSSANACTNVGCLFLDNEKVGSGRITCNKCMVNCTYAGNVSGNGNYGDIFNPACILRNCILSGNKIGGSMIDIRAIYGAASEVKTTNALDMVNCVYVKSQVGVGEDWKGLVNCKKVADVKFADAANGDYTPTTRSAAYDAGCQEPWLLSLVGAKDLAGNPRVYGGALDIGAYECQKDRPGAMLLVW